jgi:hypothetical protein
VAECEGVSECVRMSAVRFGVEGGCCVSEGGCRVSDNGEEGGRVGGRVVP